MKIKLVTSDEQFFQLLATMRQFNSACNEISHIAYNMGIPSKFTVHKACYYNVREKFGLSAEMTVRAIGKVADSYKSDKKRLHKFAETGAMVYDDRILSFKGLESASILTLEGRIKVPIIVSDYHRKLMAGRRIRGQADLILQDGIFYLMRVVELPEPDPQSNGDFLGIDLGIVNIAVDSEGETHSGASVNGVRIRALRLREKLQKKGTKSAKRLLKHRRRKEQRYARDVNHCASKRIVAKAKALGTGIALEELGGIRSRTEKTVTKQQRCRQSSWSFYQLRQFIEYKAKLAGVPVVMVDPRNTSRECPICGHIAKENRVSRNDFRCQACGYATLADNVAAVNIRSRAVCQSAIRGNVPDVTCKLLALG